MSFAERITCKLAKMGQYYSRYAFSHPDRNNFATISAPGNFSFYSQTVVLCFPFSGGSSYIVTGASQPHIHSFPSVLILTLHVCKMYPKEASGYFTWCPSNDVLLCEHLRKMTG